MASNLLFIVHKYQIIHYYRAAKLVCWYQMSIKLWRHPFEHLTSDQHNFYKFIGWLFSNLAFTPPVNNNALQFIYTSTHFSFAAYTTQFCALQMVTTLVAKVRKNSIYKPNVTASINTYPCCTCTTPTKRSK